MKNHHKQKIDALIHRLGLKYNLKDEIIKEITDAPYLFSYDVIKKLELDEVKTEEELDEIKTNFYYKGLGKLHIPFYRVNRRNQQKKNMKNLNKRKWKN